MKDILEFYHLFYSQNIGSIPQTQKFRKIILLLINNMFLHYTYLEETWLGKRSIFLKQYKHTMVYTWIKHLYTVS